MDDDPLVGVLFDVFFDDGGDFEKCGMDVGAGVVGIYEDGLFDYYADFAFGGAEGEDGDDGGAAGESELDGAGGEHDMAAAEGDARALLAGHDAVALEHHHLVVLQGIAQAHPDGPAIIDGGLDHAESGAEGGAHALEASDAVALEDDVDFFLVFAQGGDAGLEGAHVSGDHDGAPFEGAGGDIGVVIGDAVDLGGELLGRAAQAEADVVDEVVEGADDAAGERFAVGLGSGRTEEPAGVGHDGVAGEFGEAPHEPEVEGFALARDPGEVLAVPEQHVAPEVAGAAADALGEARGLGREPINRRGGGGDGCLHG